LKEVVVGPVHVDYCTKCHGVFLDRGELDQAVQAVRGTTLRQVIALAGSLAG
jgi:Zn-finger nucleic acid-binding protein